MEPPTATPMAGGDTHNGAGIRCGPDVGAYDTAGADGDRYPDPHTGSDTHRTPRTYNFSRADGDRYSDRHTGSDAHRTPHTYNFSRADGDRYSDRHTGSDAHRTPRTYNFSDSNCRSDT